MPDRHNLAKGKKAEILFGKAMRISAVENALRDAYGISGKLSDAIQIGSQQRKSDVVALFDCGRYLGANLKSYSGRGYNQLTRMSLDNFAKQFGISQTNREALRRLLLNKAKNRKAHLIPRDESQHNKWTALFQRIATEIMEFSLTNNPKFEFLALHDRKNKCIRIWKMDAVMSAIDPTVTITKDGNVLIGKCVVIQRKGGNGNRVKKRRDDPTHPGNDIQVKLKVKEFVELHKDTMLLCYRI